MAQVDNDKQTVANRILVAYASEFGSTAEVAQLIGETLRNRQTTVDVRPLVAVTNLDSYSGAIIGSPIYNGQWLPEAVDFVQTEARTLSRMPVAYFVLSMLLKDDTPEHRRTVVSFLEPVLATAPLVVPIDIGLFAGRMRYRNLPLLERVMFWVRARLPSGDFRDQQAIRAWAKQLQPAFVGKDQAKEIKYD